MGLDLVHIAESALHIDNMDRIQFAIGEIVTVRNQSGLWKVVDDDTVTNEIIVAQEDTSPSADTTTADDPWQYEILVQP